MYARVLFSIVSFSSCVFVFAYDGFLGSLVSALIPSLMAIPFGGKETKDGRHGIEENDEIEPVCDEIDDDDEPRCFDGIEEDEEDWDREMTDHSQRYPRRNDNIWDYEAGSDSFDQLDDYGDDYDDQYCEDYGEYCDPFGHDESLEGRRREWPDLGYGEDIEYDLDGEYGVCGEEPGYDEDYGATPSHYGPEQPRIET